VDPAAPRSLGRNSGSFPCAALKYPYALAFLPDGGILITERAGRLRIVRDGKLDPRPIAGMPEVLDNRQRGMNDIALHPRFAENHWIYLTYYKPSQERRTPERLWRAPATTAVIRSARSAIFFRPTRSFPGRLPRKSPSDAMARFTWRSAFPFARGKRHRQRHSDRRSGSEQLLRQSAPAER